MRSEVEFAVEDGTVLRGYLHGERRAPGILMAHGFSGVKEQIDHYASRFAEGGFSVLVHDHRGFGDSDGTPRLEVDADRQLADWRDAITFALTRPEFDSAVGIGLWGSSFAGGLAMMLAATDRRVRCVVSQIPQVSGRRNERRMFSVAQRARLDEELASDRITRLAGGVPRMIPVFSPAPDGFCALTPPLSERYIRATEEAVPAWRNEVTLRSVENMNNVEPAAWAPYISPTPFLMIVGANDTCTFPENQIETFAQAREPKRLVIHPGSHFDTYTDYFEATSRAALDWFDEHLRPRVACDGTVQPAHRPMPFETMDHQST